VKQEVLVGLPPNSFNPLNLNGQIMHYHDVWVMSRHSCLVVVLGLDWRVV
jgi:hypothetical protein